MPDPQTTLCIVERLRDERYMHPPRSMLAEAAKEIERLRCALAEIAGLTQFTSDDPVQIARDALGL